MDNPYLLNQLARIGGMPNKPVSSDAFNNYVQLGLNVPQPNQGLLNNMNNAIGTIDQENIDKEKLAEKERNRNYNRALLLGVLGDAVSGRSTVERASLLNRNFQADKEKRIAEANQQNLTSNALTIAKANGATDAQLAIIAENPTIAMGVVQSSFDQKTDKLPTSIQEYEFAKSQGFQGSLIDFINNKNPGDTFNIGNTRDVEIIKSRIELGQKDIETTKKSLETTKELLPRLNAAQRILKADDFQTGPLAAATLDIRKLYSDITGLDVSNLENQQAFDAFTKFTIPRMRPPGSGATSDFEANLFEQSTASLGKTKKANQIIIGTMLQTARREQELSMLKEEYFAEENTTIGFDKYIKDNNLMPQLYIDITSSDQAIDLFDKGLLRDGDVYIDFITDPNNPQLAVFDKRDIK